TQPWMPLGQYKRSATRLQPLHVACQDGVIAVPGPDEKVLNQDGEPHAHRQSHKIVCVREWVCLIKIVDPPNQAAFGVAPRAEVFHMQLPNCPQDRRCGHICTGFTPHLHPSIKCCPEEGKAASFHERVLQTKVCRHKWDLSSQPCFVVFRCLVN